MNHIVKTMDLIHHYPSDRLQIILRHPHDICPLKQENKLETIRAESFGALDG
jgi:hypothetical protein